MDIYIYTSHEHIWLRHVNYGHNNCGRKNMDKVTIYDTKKLDMRKRSTLYKRLLELSLYN